MYAAIFPIDTFLNDKAPKPYVNENIPLNQLMKMKPTMFLFRKKPTPTTAESVEVFGNTISEVISRKEDLIWVMPRFQSVEISKDQKAAGWTGFHRQVSSPERGFQSYLLAEYWRITNKGFYRARGTTKR